LQKGVLPIDSTKEEGNKTDILTLDIFVDHVSVGCDEVHSLNCHLHTSTNNCVPFSRLQAPLRQIIPCPHAMNTYIER
jgi:hypothetical protein